MDDIILAKLSGFFPRLLEKQNLGLDVRAALSSVAGALRDGALSPAQLNQALHRCGEPGFGAGFFEYYFLDLPPEHPYSVAQSVPPGDFLPQRSNRIVSLDHLSWGVKRFIIDSMLYWGNFRQAYRDLRALPYSEISALFQRKRYNTAQLRSRGRITAPQSIPRDSRYLISEMASYTYREGVAVRDAQHVSATLEALKALEAEGVALDPIVLRQRAHQIAESKGQQSLFDLLYEDALSESISESSIEGAYKKQLEAYQFARKAALANTCTYLSICDDLDLYLATSMRSRDDFRSMADMSARIVSHPTLRDQLNIRYFDPTLSATEFHEDKGIIECLMVKTCKALVYFAQNKESLGKVSEFAMALSLGKPVIILCPDDARGSEAYQFYRDKHPLTRLVEFNSGIVQGAMVTTSIETVQSLLVRILTGTMEYDLQLREGTKAYYLLKERLTGSTVRVITDSHLLTETFWNNYHR
jgi:hypothetical protein